MQTLSSYSSPFNFGHKALEHLFDNPVVIQEKIDGSQISFGIVEGKLSIRSRRTEIIPSEKSMFGKAVETIQSLDLVEGYVYRGEYLSKSKHNTIAYERVPKGNIILYDVDKGNQNYMHPFNLELESNRISLECVPYIDTIPEDVTIEYLDTLLKETSILGGAKIEGVVIKNYDQFDERSQKVLMAKYVSSEFKEKHENDWKKRNPSQTDFIETLIELYRTEARWNKAVQHLLENGEIKGEVQDIGILLREVNIDIMNESEEEIKEQLFKHFKKQFLRGITRGLPEWYKRKLAEEALGKEV